LPLLAARFRTAHSATHRGSQANSRGGVRARGPNAADRWYVPEAVSWECPDDAVPDYYPDIPVVDISPQTPPQAPPYSEPNCRSAASGEIL
jgi:hypothetical protein